MEKIVVHGTADSNAAPPPKHSEAFDRALENALYKASKNGFAPGTHKVRIEFKAVIEVTNPGRVQDYIVSIEKLPDDGT